MTTEPRLVTDDEVAAYQELVKHHALRMHGFHGAEYDDLFQEGCLAVFLALRNGKHPSKDIIVKRMRDWIRKCARQGFSGYADDIPE